jgi:hypothetical protein
MQILNFFTIMLEIILMLLGLALPNSESNSTTSDNQTAQTEITTQIDDDGIGATGGNSGQNPPKNP